MAAEVRHWKIQISRWGHAEAEPFLDSALRAALCAACGQDRVTVRWVRHTEEEEGGAERKKLKEATDYW